VLTLTRKPGERIVIGNDIDITIVDVTRGKVRIGITAPRGMPVHRGEVRDRIVQQNLAAAAAAAPQLHKEAIKPISIPNGLFGMSAHKRFALFEVEGTPGLQQLVSLDDELVQVCVIDAQMVLPDFPVEEARHAAGFPESAELAIAAVVTIPSDGRTPTVALAAPIVIDVGTGTGVQVILEHSNLPLVDELRIVDASEG
jgi:carbon storage regulator